VGYGSYIRTDYKPAGALRPAQGNRQRRKRLLLSVCTCTLVGVVLLANPYGKATSQAENGSAKEPTTGRRAEQSVARVSLPLALPVHESAFDTRDEPGSGKVAVIAADRALLATDGYFPPETQRSPTRGKWHEVTVKNGDTLSSILNRLDIYGELQSLMGLGSETELLHPIYPGQDLRIRISDEGMEELIFDADSTTRLNIMKNSEGDLRAELQKLAFETRQEVASGTIKRSLYLDGEQAGLSDLLILKLSELFGWDIDFALDIQKGDTFTVIYEEYYRDGEKLGDGDIIAAEFINREQVFRALRYTDSSGRTGYYTPDGRSVRRPFLRTPVEIARISSYFNLQRRHPILNTIRAHRGVDYAAPTGTPIKATGDGIVAERRSMGGYGNAVILSHGSRYTTLYGHMSRFANNTTPGQRVEQGQVIGYIGSTGLATGPHLHYEFRIDGVHYNPLTVTLPAAHPLPEAEMAAYLRNTEPLRNQLNLHVRDRVAMN
jgi:murein DD-endopeptidase MepM/ murein hydrolase activator NlpD